MKTPYDGAVRIRQNEMDDVRVAIGTQLSALNHIENLQVAVETRIKRESEVAAEQTLIPSDAYARRMRSERARLTRDKAVADEQLTVLRTQAVAAYGALHVLETAMGNFRAEAEAEIERAEQTRSDDFAATAFVRRQSKAPRAPC